MSKPKSIRTPAGFGGVAFIILSFLLIAVFATMMTFASRDGTAKPEYSKQTKFPCTKCHTGKPSKTTVNAFGKAWKKNNM